MTRNGAVQIEAMEARSVDEIPYGQEWQYEPKWDGFRCLIFRDSRSVKLQSKSGQDLTRYFPEIAAAARELTETAFVLDGELVVPVGKRLSFDDLLSRIHPAASRIERLSSEKPALFLAFDLLKRGKTDLAQAPLSKRRPELEAFAKRCFKAAIPFRLSPMSSAPAAAKRWLALAGGGCDGVVAKRIDLPYQGGNREGMQKIKRDRPAGAYQRRSELYRKYAGRPEPMVNEALGAVATREAEAGHRGLV